MSKTYSVREVAAALGITQRGVVQRLNRNQLKGTKKVNQYGTAEWQIYANKEISNAIEALKNAGGDNLTQQSFAPEADGAYEDAIDAEGVDVEEAIGQADWIDLERKRLEMLAETLVKPLTEQLAFQAAALREKELELVEKDRQLRLLPDFQKKAEEEAKAAEKEREAAEARALEVIALKKQITALETVKDEATAKAKEVDLELQKVQAERAVDIQRYEEESDKLRQKAEEASITAQKLAELEKVVQELQKPKPTFWQKFWGAKP